MITFCDGFLLCNPFSSVPLIKKVQSKPVLTSYPSTHRTYFFLMVTQEAHGKKEEHKTVGAQMVTQVAHGKKEEH
ncbi:hypothetical protein NDU88_006374 [Pleurodeles waltl]|uniref:Uncharacterized protein n=1 Tax=Pleurodeles waltl TaxID=8319 RepID=A0AAV7TZC1_PLEWA|nr:hypothetical protein NDU88_006374 [Pleurodeles waltl]